MHVRAISLVLPWVAASTLLSPHHLTGQQRPADPRDGRGVLEQMYAAYQGRWYSSLAFVQQTTIYKADGGRDTSTWFESLKGPDQLRIDFGKPGPFGGIFTAESTYIFRDGKLARSAVEGNPFLPLIMGVYLQPVEQTVRGANHHGFDLNQLYSSTWEGRRVYVVGAASASDTTSSQFWVDAERMIVVRMLLAPSSGATAADIRLGQYVKVGEGWLATHIDVLVGGKPRQVEDYTEWSSTVPIPDALFNRTTWVTTGHWALEARPAGTWQRRSP
jgi:hypothetical protein